MNKSEFLTDSHSESFYHKAVKLLIYKSISKKVSNIMESSTEKVFNNRRADIYFKLKNGIHIVIEVQHSRITIKELIERTNEYNNQNIYVLWILNGKGKCVASPKLPENKKNVKISSVEKFIHKMYGGRVYYVNIKRYKNKTKITLPFSLHFSLSDNRPNRMFKNRFEYYYFRNSNYTFIPNWNLLFNTFNEFKIARFYDKNIKQILNSQILRFLKNDLKLKQEEPYNYRNSKTIIKKTFKYFKKKYGKSIIIEIFKKINDKIKLNQNVINRYSKKFKL